MLEIKEKYKLHYGNEFYASSYDAEWELFLNDKIIEDVEIVKRFSSSEPEIRTLNSQSSKKLIELSPNDFTEKISLELQKIEEFDCFSLTIKIVEFVGPVTHNIRCFLVPQLSKWNNYYTLEQYKETFLDLSEKYEYVTNYENEFVKEALNISFGHKFTNKSLAKKYYNIC